MLSKIENHIPLNENEFFVIKKSQWSNSIDILIKSGFNFYVINLFFIFLSYLENNEVFVLNIYLCVNSKEDSKESIFVYKKVDLYYNNTLKIEFFIKWLNGVLDVDKEYILNSNFYGFRISFHDFSPFLIENKIYPSYPWVNNYYLKIKHIEKTKYFEYI